MWELGTKDGMRRQKSKPSYYVMIPLLAAAATPLTPYIDEAPTP